LKLCGTGVSTIGIDSFLKSKAAQGLEELDLSVVNESQKSYIKDRTVQLLAVRALLRYERPLMTWHNPDALSTSSEEMSKSQVFKVGMVQGDHRCRGGALSQASTPSRTRSSTNVDHRFSVQIAFSVDVA
jgi:hypothetical protein